MQYEKIYKREDGQKIRLQISYWHSNYDPVWTVKVSTCQKGKRSWIPTVDGNSYSYRKLSQEDRDKYVIEQALKHLSQAEIETAMVECWQSLKPCFNDLSGSLF